MPLQAVPIGAPPPFIEGLELSEKGEQEIAAWLAWLPDTAVSYVHHAVAGATADDLTELRDPVLTGAYAHGPISYSCAAHVRTRGAEDERAR